MSVFAPGSTSPTYTLSGVSDPVGLAFDASGNLYVANGNGDTVRVFAPGSTTPTATLSGLSDPGALAFDAHGNLFAANGAGTTVSMFAVPPPTPAAGGVVIRSARPDQPIHVGTTSGAGLAVSNAELARVFTTAGGTVTFGGTDQTGAITFTAATPATTLGAGVVAVGQGAIVLDSTAGTALAAGSGDVRLSAGKGGIVAIGGATTPSLASTGLVTLDTPAGIGASDHRILFDAMATPAAVTVGASRAPGGAVYLGGLGALTLGDVRTADAPLDVTAVAGLTVAPRAQLDTGASTISLAAGVNPDGTGSSTGGKLTIAAGASVASANAGSDAITLRGSDIDIATGANPALIGAHRVVDSTTPTATLTGLAGPSAVALDAQGNLYVANEAANTVSVFAPGGTSPTRTLTGVSKPVALAIDAQGNLFVANGNFTGTTVSVFAPGSTSPTRTLTGLSGPSALAFDAQGNLYVANFQFGTVSVFAPSSTSPTATLKGVATARALAFDAQGNLYVASGFVGSTVSVFAPGSTTPTATLTGPATSPSCSGHSPAATSTWPTSAAPRG